MIVLRELVLSTRVEDLARDTVAILHPLTLMLVNQGL